jgi:hypothetical protein
VDRKITESSEVQQLRVELYRANGKDCIRSCNCDTADGSNGVTELYKCMSEWKGLHQKT